VVVWETTGVVKMPEVRAVERAAVGAERENEGLERASAGLSRPWMWLTSARPPPRRARQRRYRSFFPDMSAGSLKDMMSSHVVAESVYASMKTR